MRRSLIVTAALACLATGIAHPAGAAASPAPVTFALIGDTPYGDAQRAQFPALVDRIDADPDVRFVLHAGDNEWTDCHRVSAGQYLPTERLEALRETFFATSGVTLGQRPMGVQTQARDREHSAYVENVLFQRGQVVVAAVHVVGSENDLDPWSQLPGGDMPAERLAEYHARLAADLDWIDSAFARASRTHAAGVLLLMQAEPVATPGFQAIRDRVVERSREFGKAVLLVHGDEHVYEVEPGYAGVANLTRLETYGDTARDWLRVTIDAETPEVFSWTPEHL